MDNFSQLEKSAMIILHRTVVDSLQFRSSLFSLMMSYTICRLVFVWPFEETCGPPGGPATGAPGGAIIRGFVTLMGPRWPLLPDAWLLKGRRMVWGPPPLGPPAICTMPTPGGVECRCTGLARWANGVE